MNCENVSVKMIYMYFMYNNIYIYVDVNTYSQKDTSQYQSNTHMCRMFQKNKNIIYNSGCIQDLES